VQLRKFGHACVRFERAGSVLVIDPGSLTEPEAVLDADAVLITHEHFDHFSESGLRAAVAARPGLEVWTVAPVAQVLSDLGDTVHAVTDGEQFTAAGFAVRAYVGSHVRVHPDLPRVENTGFLVEGDVFHPGDALTVPGVPVDTLLVPVQGSWTHLSATIDWIRQVAPRRAVAIHDSGLSAIGHAILDGYLGAHGPGIGTAYTRLEPRTAMEIPLQRGALPAGQPA
jgi:L-ascorbate metabolism protein UlaG (beta-lactamase superfamily)